VTSELIEVPVLYILGLSSSAKAPSMRKLHDESYSEQETVRRADAALKRMLTTPHKPHKPLGKKTKSRKKKATRATRERV
jgi:hypothetical protein